MERGAATDQRQVAHRAPRLVDDVVVEDEVDPPGASVRAPKSVEQIDEEFLAM